MIIHKEKISPFFSIEFKLITRTDSHGKFVDKDTDVHSIINSHLDAMKIQLNLLISSVPNKEVKADVRSENS